MFCPDLDHCWPCVRRTRARYEHFDPANINKWVAKGYPRSVISEFLEVMKAQVRGPGLSASQEYHISLCSVLPRAFGCQEAETVLSGPWWSATRMGKSGWRVHASQQADRQVHQPTVYHPLPCFVLLCADLVSPGRSTPTTSCWRSALWRHVSSPRRLNAALSAADNQVSVPYNTDHAVC